VTPPSFAGLASAAPISQTEVQLGWAEATDDVTPTSRIQYDVYQGTAAGAQAALPVATVTGAASIVVSALTADRAYYFVVRARDDAGNRSTTVVERAATTPDTTPPVFGGLTSAHPIGACGFVDPTNPCRAQFAWTAATDNGSPAAAIVYDIYYGPTSGTQNYASPSYTTDPGVSTYTAPTSQTYVGCWVVRARDRRDNRDANTTEICLTAVP
jgi:hypothetical protein